MSDHISSSFPQYTVNSNPSNNSNNSKQYTVEEISDYVDNLDKRVYVNSKFKPFYCNAVKWLGKDRVREIEQMVIKDERIDQPHLFCAERVAFAKLQREVTARQKSGKGPYSTVI